MTNWNQLLYRRLPPSARSLTASARGYYLRSWRYGPETDRLVGEALERDHWSAEQWQAYQSNRLGYILHRAATQVPYYRDQWSARRRNGDRTSWEYLENWPILEKDALRQNPAAFVAEDVSLKQMFHIHTSGTTGKPINIYWSRKSLREWYALFEARWRGWYGLSRRQRWAILGGQMITPVIQNQPPFWVWNRGMNQLYMSSYHLKPENVPLYLQAIRDYGVEYVYCYTSSGYALAVEILRTGMAAPPIQAILTNAEPISSYQREAMQNAFHCPVHETYGLSEAVLGASECDEKSLHLWLDAGCYEIVDGDQPVDVGQVGEIVSTGLLNSDMPLIRYRIGDRATLHPEDEPCHCGRSLPRLLGVEGRSDDVLYTSDGRKIGRLDPVFKADLPIREAQIVQDRLDHLVVRVVPTEGYSRKTEESISERLRERMGSMSIDFEQLSEIPRTSNGKFRAVLCNLPAEERQRVQ